MILYTCSTSCSLHDLSLYEYYTPLSPHLFLEIFYLIHYSTTLTVHPVAFMTSSSILWVFRTALTTPPASSPLAYAEAWSFTAASTAPTFWLPICQYRQCICHTVTKKRSKMATVILLACLLLNVNLTNTESKKFHLLWVIHNMNR